MSGQKDRSGEICQRKMDNMVREDLSKNRHVSHDSDVYIYISMFAACISSSNGNYDRSRHTHLTWKIVIEVIG